MARTVAAALAVLVAAAALPAAAEPLLSAPESEAPLPSPVPSTPAPAAVPVTVQAPVPVQAPATPQTDAFDCWLLDPNRLEQAADKGLCGDAFARAPEIASLPEAPPLPALTPPRKPKFQERRIRASNRGSSHSQTQAMGTSAAQVSRGGGSSGNGDFFSNFQRDFRALGDLLGGGSSPRRSDGGGVPGSHMSNRN